MIGLTVRFYPKSRSYDSELHLYLFTRDHENVGRQKHAAFDQEGMLIPVTRSDKNISTAIMA